MSVILGIVSIWIYASIRPAYGPGPKTALYAGLAVFMVGKFAVALDMLTLGVMPTTLVLGQTLLGLVAILVSTLVGAKIYKE